jgi:hypothetical protein
LLPLLAPFFVFLAYSGYLQRLQVSQSTPIQFLSFGSPKMKRIVQIPQLIHHDLRELAPESLHPMLSSCNKHTSQAKSIFKPTGLLTHPPKHERFEQACTVGVARKTLCQTRDETRP